MSNPVIMLMWGDKTVSRAEYKEALSMLRLGCSQYPDRLIDVPRWKWPSATEKMSEEVIAVLRSRKFCCQVYQTKHDGVIRLSFNRSEVELIGNVCQWKQGISWDELMQLKREAGYGERFAVEVYPEDEHIVNVAAMRHIFILKERPPFAWTKENR